MSALPGIISLVFYLYVRPHEFFDALRDWNLSYILLGICVVGILDDRFRRGMRFVATPQLRWVLLFVLWCLVTLVVRRPNLMGERFVGVTVCALIYSLIAHCVQRIRALVQIVVIVYSIALFVAYVGFDQGLSPLECVMISPASYLSAVSDGRPCGLDADSEQHDRIMSCIETGQPGSMYRCERAGLFGTTSIGGGRVRYLGMLEDPNDLALATAMATPVAFALYQMRRSFPRLLLLAGTLALIGTEVVFTGSRGGQVTFIVVLGAYFMRAYGVRRGLLVGAVMAAPMILLGGRSDANAEGSTLERLGCACAGIKMLVFHPILGVGYTLFTEEHPLTAHNAYILAAGELGIPGMSIFAFLLYLSLKVPYAVLRFDLAMDADGRAVKAMAMGLLAGLGGGAVGIFFLSWTFHYVLWVQLGLSGALYSVVKVAHPTFECTLSWREASRIVVGYLVVLVFWSGYIRYKGAWE